MDEINNLVLKANDLRYQAFLKEQEALTLFNEKVLGMKTITAKPTANLSPLVVDSIQQNLRTLRFHPPLTLKPNLDEEDGSLLVIEQGEINLHVYASTHKQLYDDLIAELFFLWDEYAKEADENLTTKAQKIKANLLARCQEH